METQTKEFFEEEAHCQEDGWKNKQNQDAWIQGKDTPSGDSLEEEINRLKTLLAAERARFNEEHQRANDLEKGLHDAKLKLEKRKFNENDVGACSEAKKESNASEDIEFSELLVENKALQHQLGSSQEKQALLQREMQESMALCQEVLAKLETDIINLSEQVATLQEELEVYRRANSQTNMNRKFFKMMKDENTEQSTELKTCLQSETNQVKEANLEMTVKFETDVLTLERPVCSLEQELKDDKESHVEMVKINKMLYAELQAENETLCQKMASIQDASIEAERRIQKELDQVKDVSLEMVQKYEVHILTLTEEIETMEQEHREERYRHADVEIRNGKRAKFLHAEKNLLQKELEEVKRMLLLNELETTHTSMHVHFTGQDTENSDVETLTLALWLFLERLRSDNRRRAVTVSATPNFRPVSLIAVRKQAPEDLTIKTNRPRVLFPHQ
ncbi:hypothetical protein CCH79_00008850 [Gambusia affinis]|uniref:Uncharacterized protein n=1 Tax=Gambusia affinis TaxID=33528 RepID=A0A315UY35_GAMAF|nr:hypothetical protein CCH79_00008850 [Gambusia affinis]